MTWAQKRKMFYVGGIIVFLLIFVGLPLFIFFYKSPTCFDGKKNQDETGVDCGGRCNLLCPSQYSSLNILWSRISKVSDGVYNVLAYIENPNIDAQAENVKYVFKLYSADGMLLRERSGQTYVPAQKTIAVFEPELKTGTLLPKRVEFVITSPVVWVKQTETDIGLSATLPTISREDTTPRLSFTLTNRTTEQIKKIEAISIIYNLAGNTINFSRTVVDSVMGKESKIVDFNWREPFSDKYARSEIILKLLK